MTTRAWLGNSFVNGLSSYESFFSRQANRTTVPSSIMNGTNVSNTILERLAGELAELTPEARKAATYVLENPRDVGVSTVREIA